jgi:NAD(P)-dependent dehydrogenase (short-subunit alcohol dehydrogenase family)
MSTESVSAPAELVAGADKGIGLERAGRLAGAGYRVYLTAQQRARRGCCRDRRLRRAGRGGSWTCWSATSASPARCVRPARLHRRQTHRRSGRTFHPQLRRLDVQESRSADHQYRRRRSL